MRYSETWNFHEFRGLKMRVQMNPLNLYQGVQMTLAIVNRRFKWTLQSENVNPIQNSAVVCWPEKNYVLTTFEGCSLLHFASYCHSGTFFVCFRNVIKYGKVAHFTAFYCNLGGNMKPTRVLFVCHGNISSLV